VRENGRSRIRKQDTVVFDSARRFWLDGRTFVLADVRGGWIIAAGLFRFRDDRQVEVDPVAPVWTAAA
jgi:hypothetical protein